MKIVIVNWNDAHQSGSDTDAAEEFHKPVAVQSIGWLVKSDAVGVTLAACCDFEGDFERKLFVPRGMVTKVRELR